MVDAMHMGDDIPRPATPDGGQTHDAPATSSEPRKGGARRATTPRAGDAPAIDPTSRPPGATRPATPRGGLAIVYRSLRDLAPYANNARTHTARQIEKLRTSLARFGWTNPPLIADGVLIAGHARVTAAIAMAEAGQPIVRNPDPWRAPTIDLSHLSPEDRRAYVITDNRLAEDAGWDRDLLRVEIGDLRAAGYDDKLLGFDVKELTTIMGDDRSGARPELTAGMTYQVLVECEGESHQARVLEDLAARGLKSRPLIL